jgi:cell pole-organizing protein PopZ
MVMAVQSAVPKQSVEEILASIRQAIAEDESRRRPTLKAVPQLSASDLAASTGPHAFASANDDEWAADTDLETQNVIELAIEKAIDGVSAALSDTMDVVAPAAIDEARDDREERGSDGRANGMQPRPLLSARQGAAVAASFDDLARTIAGLSQTQIRDMAQEMLRPMLKGWLDDNLPSMVERMVREEIERVSRGR